MDLHPKDPAALKALRDGKLTMHSPYLDAAFLLTVGSFLLTVELFYLQLTIFGRLIFLPLLVLTRRGAAPVKNQYW